MGWTKIVANEAAQEGGTLLGGLIRKLSNTNGLFGGRNMGLRQMADHADAASLLRKSETAAKKAYIDSSSGAIKELEGKNAAWHKKNTDMLDGDVYKGDKKAYHASDDYKRHLEEGKVLQNSHNEHMGQIKGYDDRILQTYAAQSSAVGASIKRYMTGGSMSQILAKHAVLASPGIIGVGTRYASGGSLTQTSDGRGDIAGIPFI